MQGNPRFDCTDQRRASPKGVQGPLVVLGGVVVPVPTPTRPIPGTCASARKWPSRTCRSSTPRQACGMRSVTSCQIVHEGDAALPAAPECADRRLRQTEARLHRVPHLACATCELLTHLRCADFAWPSASTPVAGGLRALVQAETMRSPHGQDVVQPASGDWPLERLAVGMVRLLPRCGRTGAVPCR
jgi:hypothetical protein